MRIMLNFDKCSIIRINMNSVPNILIGSRYRKLKQIGTGSFGTVFLGRKKESNLFLGEDQFTQE
jgi:serine/threonine protein kinase